MSNDTARENELICERLLGWKRDTEGVHAYPAAAWFARDGQGHYTPTFTTWAEAGMILDWLAEHDYAPELVHTLTDWLCFINHEEIQGQGDTGPLAIRAVALSYIRAVGPWCCEKGQAQLVSVCKDCQSNYGSIPE